LIFEIITDGSIHPKHALTEAAKTIDSPLHVIPQTENSPLKQMRSHVTETYDEESLHMRQLLKTKLVDMELSVRALNRLKAAEVETLVTLYLTTKTI
jgi:DNA-directed RNA polymerase subunit alpha